MGKGGRGKSTKLKGKLAKQDAGELSEENSLLCAVVGIQEKHRTIRIAIVAAAVLVGMGIVAWVIVSLVSQPWYIALLEVLITALGVGWPIKKVFKIEAKFQDYMKTDHDRVLRLEAEIDPDRSTSGMNKDGTSPDRL